MEPDPFSHSVAPTPETPDASAESAIPAFSIREGRLDDLFPLMEIITQELSLGRQHLALASLSEAVKGKGSERVFSVVAVREGRVVAGAVATRVADDAAQFIGFGCHGSIRPDQQLDLSRSLADRLHQRLQSDGFQFVQASCDASDDAPRCASVGYEWIATLDYLQADVNAMLDDWSANERKEPSLLWQAAGLDCQQIDPCETPESWQRMVNLVQSTYEQTLDCPRLNGFRSAADVVGAYVTASSFQPEGWRMISENGRDVACLVTVGHGATNTVELTYMGIAPSHRGRGIGKLLVSEAARIARTKASDRIVLAVDQANRPAHAVYRQCEFEKIGSEAVWGRNLSPTPSRRSSGPMQPNVRKLPKTAS